MDYASAKLFPNARKTTQKCEKPAVLKCFWEKEISTIFGIFRIGKGIRKVRIAMIQSIIKASNLLTRLQICHVLRIQGSENPSD